MINKYNHVYLVQYSRLQVEEWVLGVSKGTSLSGTRKPHTKHHPCSPVMGDQKVSIILRKKAAEKEKGKGKGQ